MAKLTTPVQGILFDVDGTILDTMHPQYLWLQRCAQQYGGRTPFPQFGPGFLKEYSDWYERKSMPGLYEMVGVDFQTHCSEIWREYNKFNRVHDIQCIPGVAPAISQIFVRSRISRKRSNALRLGLNTTKTWEDIETPLSRAGITGCLDMVVTKDDIYSYAADGALHRKRLPYDDFRALREALPEHVVRELEKPHTLASFLSVQRLGCDPQSIIAFEDTALGISSYKAVLLPRQRADIYVVGVTWGYQPDKAALMAAQPDQIIDTPEQMVELIGDLGGF